MAVTDTTAVPTVRIDMQNLTCSTLTENDLIKRKYFLTASDVPAVMGTSPWKNRADVWYEKCCDTEPIQQNKAMFWGSMLEGVIIKYAVMRLSEKLGKPDLKATRVGVRRVHRNGVMSCTLDALIKDTRDAIEAKSHASIHPNVNWDEWGKDDFTSAIPVYYKDQICAQFACCPDLERIWIPVSIRQMEPIIYLMEREHCIDRIIKIENECCDFNDRYLLTNTPPPDAPSLEVIKRVKVPIDTTAIAPLDDLVVERFKRTATLIGRLEKRKDTWDATIKAAMLGKTLGKSPKGHMVKLSTVDRAGYTVDATSYQRMNVTLVK